MSHWGPQQRPPYGFPGHPHPHPYRPQRPDTTGRVLGAGCLGCGAIVAAVVVVLIVIGLFATNIVRTEMAKVTPFPTPTPGPTVYRIEERPGFKEMRSHVTAVSDKYTDMGQRIWDVAPHGRRTNPTYINFFCRLMLDEKLALMWRGDDSDSLDPTELDEIIRGQRRDVDELERRFLAGEPISNPHFLRDGKVVVVEAGPDVKEEPIPTPPPKQDQDATAFDAEKRMAATPARPGADGTYRETGERLAALFQMKVEYNWEALYQACPSGGRIDKALAAYCTASPYVVYVNKTNKVYPSFYSDPGYDDIIRHEVAHRRIHDICGTSRPPIAGVGYEGVTNSYAVAYLGANRDRLQPSDPTSLYRMSARSDETARAIHEGRCQ